MLKKFCNKLKFVQTISYWRDKSRFCKKKSKWCLKNLQIQLDVLDMKQTKFFQQKKTVDTSFFKKLFKKINRPAQKVVRTSISLFQSRQTNTSNKNGELKISSNCIVHVNALQRKYTTILLIVTMTKNHRLRKAPVYWRLEPQCDCNRLEYQKNQSCLPWIMIQFQWHSKQAF